MENLAFLAQAGSLSPEATQQPGTGGTRSNIPEGIGEARLHRPSFLKGIGSRPSAQASRQRGAEANTCMSPRSPTGVTQQRPRYLKGLGQLPGRQPAACRAQPEDTSSDGAVVLIDEIAEQDSPEASSPPRRRSSKRKRHEHGFNEAAQVTALELAILTAGVLLPHGLEDCALRLLISMITDAASMPYCSTAEVMMSGINAHKVCHQSGASSACRGPQVCG